MRARSKRFIRKIKFQRSTSTIARLIRIIRSPGRRRYHSGLRTSQETARPDRSGLRLSVRVFSGDSAVCLEWKFLELVSPRTRPAGIGWSPRAAPWNSQHCGPAVRQPDRLRYGKALKRHLRRHLRHILISATGKVHDDEFVLVHLRRALDDF